MIKNWNSFNEDFGFFSRKKQEEPKTGPKIMSTSPRPSEEEAEKIQQDLERLKKPVEPRIDSDFLQEVSDRLYGPDSEQYVQELRELNKRFRPRRGKYGRQFYDPSQQDLVKQREQEIIKSINKDK